jgi:hypothetical protein
MYVYSVYLVMSKRLNQQSNCLERWKKGSFQSGFFYFIYLFLFIYLFIYFVCVCVFLWSLRLYCFRFLPLFNMNHVPENIYIGQWSYIEDYPINTIWLLKWCLPYCPTFWNYRSNGKIMFALCLEEINIEIQSLFFLHTYKSYFC